MNSADFTRQLLNTQINPLGRTAQALRMVLVDGITAYAASKAVGVEQSAISRAKRALNAAAPATHCPKCGHHIE